MRKNEPNRNHKVWNTESAVFTREDLKKIPKEDRVSIEDVPGLSEALENSKEATIKFAKEENMPVDGKSPPFWNNCMRRSIPIPGFENHSLDVKVVEIMNSDRRFAEYILKNDGSKLRVLDIGCGICQYAPLFHHLGFKTFVGIDLFDMRTDVWGDGGKILRKITKGAKVIMEAAGMKDYWIIAGDAKDSKSLIEEHVSNWEEGQKFDVILAAGVCYNKAEGISEKDIQVLADELLDPDGFLLIVT
tara:strand:- start:6186 stop:6923 length:738 start_codon:yes stop_codon:yes gene_type:complete